MKRYAAVAFGVAAAYLIWVAAIRDMDNRTAERAHRARIVKRYPASVLPESNEVRILQFYAGSGELTRGDQAIVCYGVENARRVELDPPVEALKPALNRCFTVRPTSDTTYRLTAFGAGETKAAAEFSLRVTPPRPHILFVSISHKEIQRGDPWTFCYGARNAVKARLDPWGLSLPPIPRYCYRSYPQQTSNFRITAWGEDLRTDEVKFRLVVH